MTTIDRPVAADSDITATTSTPSSTAPTSSPAGPTATDGSGPSALPPTVDESPDPQAVAERMIGLLNAGGVAVLLGIGHQLGLFETLATLPPATSQQIADAAALDERYVREWLAGLVTAGIIEHEPGPGRYALRADHVPFLTGPTPDNLARTFPLIALMGQVTPLVREAFRTGGGLAYADYPGFHDGQGEESRAVLDHTLLDVTIPLTGEAERLRAGIDVVDVGCGQGHAVNLLARAYPESRFTGLDFESSVIEVARAEAASWGLTNATFITCDVTEPPKEAAYDLVTAFDTIHDQARPATVLANARRALRPGGTFLMVDISASSDLEKNRGLPWAGFLYAISTFHCMSVSLGQGGDGLGTVWGVELAEQMLHEAGFSTVEVITVEADPLNAYFVARP